MKKINERLLLLILTLSGISYVFYFIYSIKNGDLSLWTYDISSVSTPSLGRYFIFLKDILCAVLIILCFKCKKSVKLVAFISLISAYGILPLIFSNFSVRYLIAGMRNLMYVIAVVMFINANENNNDIKIKFYKVIRILLYIQFLVVLIQFVVFKGEIRSIGRGGYRYMGLYANSGALAYFSLIGAMYVLVLHIKYKLVSLKNLFEVEALSFVLIIFSGSRLSLISISIILLATIIERIKLTNIIKTIFASIIGLCTFPILLGFIEKYADRGNVLDAQIQGGRIFVIKNFLYNSTLNNIVLGKGLGYGTNTAINMGIKSPIMDGTFNTIITQFGLLGFCMFLIILFGLICKVNSINKDISFICLAIEFIVLLLMLSVNIFEQVTFIIVLTYMLSLLLDTNCGSNRICNRLKY